MVFCSIFVEDFVGSGCHDAAEDFGAYIHEVYDPVLVGVLGPGCFGYWYSCPSEPFWVVLCSIPEILDDVSDVDHFRWLGLGFIFFDVIFKLTSHEVCRRYFLPSVGYADHKLLENGITVCNGKGESGFWMENESWA